MQNKKQIILSCVLLLAIFAAFTFFYQKKLPAQEPVSETAFKLNTVVTVTLYDSDDRSLIAEALALCDKYEALFSRTKESSELYQLNHGTLPQDENGFSVSPETAELIAKGLEYGALSAGNFDIAIEPVSSLWDFTSGEKKLPDAAAIEAALPFVNYQDVHLNKDHVQFTSDHMGLDLGAIAKGYIADKMKEFLVSRGVKSATINLGGNVLCIGKKPDGSPFRIGIQKPFGERSETVGTLGITDQSVVSSGIYERFFEKDGRLYHHILNPATGYPYETSLISVTIISDKSIDGDGLSTTCFALGLEKGMELIDSLPDVHALFITDDYELHYSEGFPK